MPRKTFRLKITTPELINKINPDNKKLVDKFLRNFNTKRSDTSVNSYTSNFNIFFVWNLLYNNNTFFIDIKKSQLVDFFDYAVTDLKWSSNRFAQVHSSLSSLSTFIENILDDEYPDFKNNIKKIEKLHKELVREKSIFSTEELENLSKWLKSKGLTQEVCLLSLIMSSGARISELTRFTTELIDLNNVVHEGLFLETTKEMQVKGRGKTGKKIYRYIIKDIFEPHYINWLTQRDKIMSKNNQEHNYIFIKKDGSPADPNTLRRWMKKWTKFLGKTWYAHAGRHYWTTYLIKSGCEADFVQDLQKWSDSSLVSLYNDSTSKEKKWKGLDKLKANLEGSKL